MLRHPVWRRALLVQVIQGATHPTWARQLGTGVQLHTHRRRTRQVQLAQGRVLLSHTLNTKCNPTRLENMYVSEELSGTYPGWLFSGDREPYSYPIQRPPRSAASRGHPITCLLWPTVTTRRTCPRHTIFKCLSDLLHDVVCSPGRWAEPDRQPANQRAAGRGVRTADVNQTTSHTIMDCHWWTVDQRFLQVFNGFCVVFIWAYKSHLTNPWLPL